MHTRLPAHESGLGARLVGRMTCSILRGATTTEQQYSMQRYEVGTRSKRPQGRRDCMLRCHRTFCFSLATLPEGVVRKYHTRQSAPKC